MSDQFDESNPIENAGTESGQTPEVPLPDQPSVPPYQPVQPMPQPPRGAGQYPPGAYPPPTPYSQPP